MTIRLKPFHSAVYVAFFRLLTGLVFVNTIFPGNAQAAEFSIKPALTINEEYNDNIFLTQTNNQEEYITRITPEVILHYETGFWIWDVDYAPEYRHYRNLSIEDEFANILHVRNHIKLINPLLFVDFNYDRNRISLDITRDFTKQSPIVNQVDQNICFINPYLVLKPSTNTYLKLGYIYQDIHLSEDTHDYYVTDTTVPAIVNRVENIAYADIDSEILSGIKVITKISYKRDKNTVENYDQTDVYTGPRYTYAPNSFLYFQIGKQWVDFENSPSTTGHVFWNAGITHNLSFITIFLERTSLYVQDPKSVLTHQDKYLARIQYDTPRTEIAISKEWSEYREGQINEFHATSHDTLIRFLYRLTPRTTCIFSAGHQQLEDKILQADTRINKNSFLIQQLLMKNLTLNLEYQYFQSHSQEIESNNYTINRILFGLKKDF